MIYISSETKTVLEVETRNYFVSFFFHTYLTLCKQLSMTTVSQITGSEQWEFVLFDY